MMEIAATILLARNDEPGNGGWIQLVIFVILGLVYALGGLAKMKANKAAEDEDKTKEEPKRRPRYKPLDDIFPSRQAGAKSTAAPSVPRTTPRPARETRSPAEMPIRRERIQAARIPQVKKRPARPTVKKPTLSATKKPMSPMSSLETTVPSKLGKLEKLGIDFSRGLKEGEQELAGRVVLDYENPYALREAIVHYEILGKPLCLRGPGQHMWEV
jgi:hypothetical protein